MGNIKDKSNISNTSRVKIFNSENYYNTTKVLKLLINNVNKAYFLYQICYIYIYIYIDSVYSSLKAYTLSTSIKSIR